MKVKNKFKITNTFIASIKILADDDDYWKANLAFVCDIQNLEYCVLTKKQKERIVYIVQDLRKLGMIK